MKKSLLLLIMVLTTTYLFSQKNVSLIGHLAYNDYLNDVCSWVDSTGKEYAIVGLQNGVSIVDLSDPANPKEVQRIPGPYTYWRDIDTWKNTAYVTNEASGGLMVIDLENFDTVNYSNVTYFTGNYLQKAHTIFIDEYGYAYLFGANINSGGVVMFDVTSPAAIVKAGEFQSFYIHDGYARHDTLWAAAISAGYVAIMDMTDKSSPKLLATQPTPYATSHNTGLSDNGKYLFTTDEVSNSFITSYDVSDLNNIKELDRIRSTTGSQSSAHNVYVNGNYLVTSWYTDGLRIIDATYPDNLVEVGSYDTSPLGTNSFDGDWSADKDLPSGLILASDVQQGLFIFKPTYIQGCYLKGLVSSANDSSLIYGAAIEILSTPITTSSDLVGYYSTGYADSGSYEVVFSKPGYYSDTVIVNLQNGIIDTVNIYLQPMLSFTVSGTVIDSATLNPIANCNVLISNEQLTYSDTTDSMGNFQMPNFFAGDYEVVAGKWGYVTQCFSSQTFSALADTASLELVPGIYDDFSFDYNWTISGTGKGIGEWERGDPLGTSYFGVFLNPDEDVSGDCYTNAYVTGNTGFSYDDDDVDKTAVKLFSPIFDLTTYSTPFIHFYRWFIDADEFGLGDDYMKVSITNGINTVDLNKFYSDEPYGWVLYYYNIANFITSTATMQMTFEVRDNGDDHMVEAGIDQFQVLNYQLPGALSAIKEKNNSTIAIEAFPNPYTDECTILFSPKDFNYKDLQLQVFDITGKLISKNTYTSTDGIIKYKTSMPAGVYFMKISNAEATSATLKITKIE